MPRIFVSYRREDSQWFSVLLHRELSAAFGANNVFLDTSNIPPGSIFPAQIHNDIARCDCLVAVIGPKWMTVTDKHGRRRIDQPDDYVRGEIATAITFHKKILPLLVDGAPDLVREALPEDLRQLADVNRMRIQPENLEDGIAALTNQLKMPGLEELMHFLGIEASDPQITVYLSDHRATAARMLFPLLDNMVSQENCFHPNLPRLRAIHNTLSTLPEPVASQITFVSAVELVEAQRLVQDIESYSGAANTQPAVGSTPGLLKARLEVCPGTYEKLALKSPVVFIGGPRSNRGTLYFMYELEAGIVRLGLVSSRLESVQKDSVSQLLSKDQVGFIAADAASTPLQCNAKTRNLGIIQRHRVQLPDGTEQMILYLGGSGVNGTAAAIAYFRLRWRSLYQQFGLQNFAVVLECDRREEGGDVSLMMTRQWDHRDWIRRATFVQSETGTISSIPPRLVFTDLDGTLLDAHTYSAADSMDAVRHLQERDIPIVFCSSKTQSEQQAVQNALEVYDPFIVENGSAIVIPAYALKPLPDAQLLENGRWCIVLGTPAAMVLERLKLIQSDTGLSFKTFLDYTVRGLAELTGLDHEAAKRAQEREYSAAVVAQFTAAELETFRHASTDHHLKCHMGGRFIGVVGEGADKGEAVKLIASLYKKQYGLHETIGIGDSPNDLPMLHAVDRPFLVQRPDKSWLPVSLLPNLTRIDAVGPFGFSMTVERLLDPGQQPI